MSLVLELGGMTANELAERMTTNELAEWCEFFKRRNDKAKAERPPPVAPGALRRRK